MQYIKLSIPVKTYVRKYIEMKFPGQMKLSRYRNTIGYYVLVCLEKQNSNWYKKSFSMMQKRYELLTDKIVVHLPSNVDIFYRTGFSIPPEKSSLINDLFEERIIEEIYCRSNFYQRMGFSRCQAIEDFCNEYGIFLDKDISQAALKKAEYRHRTYYTKKLQEKNS